MVQVQLLWGGGGGAYFFVTVRVSTYDRVEPVLFL